MEYFPFLVVLLPILCKYFPSMKDFPMDSEQPMELVSTNGMILNVTGFSFSTFHVGRYIWDGLYLE